MSEQVETLQILLDKLSVGIDGVLLKKNEKFALDFLQGICSKSNEDYMTSKPPTMMEEASKTIVEDIAELDQLQRRMESVLKQKIAKAPLEAHSALIGNRKTIKSMVSQVDSMSAQFITPDDLSHLVTPEIGTTLKAVEILKPGNSLNYDDVNKILEIPTRLTKSIDAGNYNQALDIQQEVNVLNIKYNSSIISKVEEKVNKEMHRMTHSLIVKLAEEASVKKVLGYLTSLIPEDQLRMVLLYQRNSFIKKELDGVPKSLAVDAYLKRCIEVIREYGFQTLNFYIKNFGMDDNAINFNAQIVQSLIGVLHNITSGEEGNQISEGLVLQLVYCAYRFGDLSEVFKDAFLEKLKECVDVEDAIKKREQMEAELNAN